MKAYISFTTQNKNTKNTKNLKISTWRCAQSIYSLHPSDWTFIHSIQLIEHLFTPSKWILGQWHRHYFEDFLEFINQHSLLTPRERVIPPVLSKFWAFTNIFVTMQYVMSMGLFNHKKMRVYTKSQQHMKWMGRDKKRIIQDIMKHSQWEPVYKVHSHLSRVALHLP